MAAVVLGLVKRTGPLALPRLDEISVDSTVLLFGLVMSMASGLLFGLVPVANFATPQLSEALQGAGRTQTQSRERHRTQSTLAVVQVALALLLLVSAGLMIRTFQNLRQVQPGFTQPEHVQTFRIVIPEAQVRDPQQVVRMQQAILDRIATIPGVAASSFAQSVPMDSRTDHDPIVVEGRADTDRQMANIRTYNFVAPGFFRAVGARLIAGRDFTWTDVYERRPVAVVSENLARELWRDPATGIGRRVRENLKGPWREVIGVVGDVHDEGIDRQAPTMVYWPTVMNEFLGQGVMVKRSIGFVIRSDRTGTEGFAEELQNAVWGANKELPLADMQTLDAIYRRSMSRTSFALVMLAIAGGMALVLGLVGVYAVIASSVSRRTQEIGIRLALGGRRVQVMAHLLRHSLVLTATGIVIGTASAVALTRFLEGILFGVSPLDPFTFLAVSLMLMIVALLAAHIPVHRATRLDPMATLRTE
jgi:predicted permease